MILGKYRADYRETTSLINKIAQYMGQAFLVAATVPVKGFLMVVDQDSLIVLYRCSCHTPMPFDFTGIVQGRAIRRRADRYMALFPFTRVLVQSVCMTG